jgi:hypothetical protein
MLVPLGGFDDERHSAKIPRDSSNPAGRCLAGGLQTFAGFALY